MEIKQNQAIRNRYKIWAFVIITAMIGSSNSIYSQKKAAKASSQELAKVAILSYDDKTGTKNFAYMSESLSDAVNRSLKKNFQYRRIGAGKVKLAQNKANLTMTNAKELKKIEAIAKSTKADIIVFGEYVFDSKAKELVITTKVYLAGANNIRTLPKTRNAVDSTIFRATAIVAATLVTEINVMIVELKKKRGEATDEKPDKGKKKLTKDLSGKKSIWLSKKKSTGIVLMPTYLPENDNTGLNKISIHFRKKLKNRLYTNLSIDLLQIQKFVEYSNQTVETKFTAASLTATIGYMIPVQRFNFFGEIGGGYFIGESYAVFATAGGEVIEDTAYNAVATARLGAEFLLLPWISIGVITDYTMYYDNISPIHSLSTGIVARYFH